MNLGRYLKNNSTIGIVSPASPSPKIIIDNYLESFKKLGFNIKLGNCLYKKNNYLTDIDELRAKEIMDMFLDPEVDGIISFRGGYGSIRLLPFLDMNIIKNNPKFFCGFSDITILINYFAENGLIACHGPMIKSNFKNSTTIAYMKKLMLHPSKGLIYTFDNIPTQNKDFDGILKGGNLTMICSSIGTPYEINLDNSILLLEEINEAPYSIDRMLTQLILSNKLKKCNGILLGHFTNCNDTNISNDKLIHLIKDILSPLQIPIISNIPFGHDCPNITFPIGCYAKYEYKSNRLILCDNILR